MRLSELSKYNEPTRSPRQRGWFGKPDGPAPHSLLMNHVACWESSSRWNGAAHIQVPSFPGQGCVLSSFKNMFMQRERYLVPSLASRYFLQSTRLHSSSSPSTAWRPQPGWLPDPLSGSTDRGSVWWGRDSPWRQAWSPTPSNTNARMGKRQVCCTQASLACTPYRPPSLAYRPFLPPPTRPLHLPAAPLLAWFSCPPPPACPHQFHRHHPQRVVQLCCRWRANNVCSSPFPGWHWCT